MRPRARCGVLCDFIVFAACIGALVVSILSQKIGYGDVSFAPGHGGEHRQHVSFGFDIVCVRSASASSADDQTMSDDQIQYVDPVCFRYQDASQQALGQVIPYGSHVVALVAEQLAGPMGPVLKAFNLVSVASFALVLALLLLPLVARLVLCSRVFERPAPAAFLARVSVMALLLGLLSSAGLSAGISSQLSAPTSWLSKPTVLWSAYETRKWAPLFAGADIEGSDINDPIGLYAVAAAGVATYFGWLCTFWLGRGDEAYGRPSCVCCCPGAGEGRGRVGCCGERWLALELPECYRACHYSKRTTTSTSIDNSLVTCMRLSTAPCFLGVHLGTLTVAVLAATTPTVSLSSQVPLYNSSEYLSLSSQVQFTYTLGPLQGCLVPVDDAFVGNGYAMSDCYGIDSPRRLFLQSPHNHTPPVGPDFSVDVMTPAAPFVRSYAAFARTIVGSMTCVVLVLLCYMLCNVREGRAAECFKRWGCVSAAVLLVAAGMAVLGAFQLAQSVSAIAAIGATQRYTFSQRSLNDDDVSPDGVRQFLSPVAGPLEARMYNTFGTFITDLQLSGGGLPAVLVGMCLASAALLLPLALCVFCGVRNGESAVLEAADGPPRLGSPFRAWLLGRRGTAGAGGGSAGADPLIPRSNNAATQAAAASAGWAPDASSDSRHDTTPSRQAAQLYGAAAAAAAPAPSAPPRAPSPSAPKVPPSADAPGAPKLPPALAPHMPPAHRPFAPGLDGSVSSSFPGAMGAVPPAPTAPGAPGMPPGAAAAPGNGSRDDDWMMQL